MTEKYSIDHLIGQNAFLILGYVGSVMRKEKKTQDEIETYTKKATQGDYDHLLKISEEIINELNKNKGYQTLDKPLDCTDINKIFPDREFDVIIKKPGKWFIGDICYALKEDIYDKKWGGGEFNYENGSFQDFVVGGTFIGDGEYYDQYSNNYPVDAGVIGITHESVWGDKYTEERLSELGKIVEVEEQIRFEYPEKGIFRIYVDTQPAILIDTKCFDEEEEEDEN